MITITVKKRNGNYLEFVSKGHAGYAEEGQDIVCSAVSALVINWAMISLAHMKFRRAKQEQGVVTRFPALLYPLGNWICLLFMAAVLVIMLMTPGMAISVYLIPVWLIVLGIGYLFKEKTAKAVKAH